MGVENVTGVVAHHADSLLEAIFAWDVSLIHIYSYIYEARPVDAKRGRSGRADLRPKGPSVMEKKIYIGGPKILVFRYAAFYNTKPWFLIEKRGFTTGPGGSPHQVGGRGGDSVLGSKTARES